jgi:hypothetical protein
MILKPRDVMFIVKNGNLSDSHFSVLIGLYRLDLYFQDGLMG